jgi:hypothetical protein
MNEENRQIQRLGVTYAITASVWRHQKEKANCCSVWYAIIAAIKQNGTSWAEQNSKEQSKIDSEKWREVIRWITWRILKLLAVFKPYLTLFWRFQDECTFPFLITLRLLNRYAIFKIESWQHTTPLTHNTISYFNIFYHVFSRFFVSRNSDQLQESKKTLFVKSSLFQLKCHKFEMQKYCQFQC